MAVTTLSGAIRRILISQQNLGATGSLLHVQEVPGSLSFRRQSAHISRMWFLVEGIPVAAGTICLIVRRWHRAARRHHIEVGGVSADKPVVSNAVLTKRSTEVMWRFASSCCCYCGLAVRSRKTSSPRQDRVTTHVNIREASEDGLRRLDNWISAKDCHSFAACLGGMRSSSQTGSTGFVSRRSRTVSRALEPRQPDELRIHFLNIATGSCARNVPGPIARR